MERDPWKNVNLMALSPGKHIKREINPWKTVLQMYPWKRASTPMYGKKWNSPMSR